jgi:hypothetical protein
MSRRAVAAAFALLLLTVAVGPARAAEPALQLAPNSDAEQLLCVTIGRLVEALGQALQDVPRYAPPEMDSQGNIILRRLDPPSAEKPDRAPAWTADQAST